jgi:membrane-associated progesterone receptor component
MEIQKPIKLLKSEGDRLLKSGGYSEAIKLYSNALDAGMAAWMTGGEASFSSADRAVLLANRALARLERKQPSDAKLALVDARQATEVAPGYAKAHYRLGKALEALGRHDEAAAAVGVAQELFAATEEGGRVKAEELEAAEATAKVNAQAQAGGAVEGAADGGGAGTVAAAPPPPPAAAAEAAADFESLERSASAADDVEDPEAAEAAALAALLAATPVPDVTFTAASLAPFVGEDGNPIYIALGRKVYDVSTGADFYGPGNGYSKFAGKDASRAMAKMSFDPADVDARGCEELTEEQRKTLADWIAKVRVPSARASASERERTRAPEFVAIHPSCRKRRRAAVVTAAAMELAAPLRSWC